ncbi:leucine-rich repeat-containing protein 70-like [Aphidius gifuensis]|uniref:leucine-rich repeat-containing protein 70-like n=1 Tax=Aphidius gifuensis TaxID=684658 RepID=UPI001CDC891F|nr:leucine-rich repeat-containing protein 70-like [Aphidius gifuensis]
MTKEIAENKNRSTRGINCYCSNNFIFEICLADNILASVKEIFIRDDVKTLNILDNRISRIGYAAFSAIPHIENLIIISAAKNFEIRRNSFEGLSNLKSLKLITTPIILYSFELLKNLKYLELIPQGILSCDLISELENLNVFGIINSTECQFKCYRQCISDTFDESKFLSLYYKGGSFKKVPAKAFSCLNRVNKIIITSSDLEIIEPEAFDGLQNLETLAITWNNNFTRIEKNVFSNFANLKSLILSHNSISFIDDGGLKTIKSEVHNSKLSYLDLSYNKLKYIESPIFGDTIITELKIDNTKMINKNDKFENVRTIFAVNDLTVVNDLSAVLPDYENNLSVDLHLNLSLDTDELSIGKNAFKNIERDCSIKTLTISKSHSSGIEFFYYTFFGLSNLENIIFNVGPIEVNINLPYRTLKLVNISNNQLSSSLKPKTFDGIICKVFDMTGSGYERNAISLFGDSCIEYLMITENLEFLKTCSSTALNSD